ncbi:MAG: hypothetical protein JWP17_667, partial [Solirubrobacterales bacterium]|nr:hypothetical protein [Solirubrobacterales bacterium]
TPGATPPAATATTTSTTSTTAAAGTTRSADGGPAPLLVGLIVLLVLAALVLVGWTVARLTAWEPVWLPRARHSLGEAGYRSGAAWDDFRDWLRPGRH